MAKANKDDRPSTPNVVNNGVETSPYRANSPITKSVWIDLEIQKLFPLSQERRLEDLRWKTEPTRQRWKSLIPLLPAYPSILLLYSTNFFFTCTRFASVAQGEDDNDNDTDDKGRTQRNTYRPRYFWCYVADVVLCFEKMSMSNDEKLNDIIAVWESKYIWRLML